MAKKILAVVLAVMMAVSAMAVTAFADQRIDLYRNGDKTYRTESITFDIPVYGLYGYLTAGDYMMVDLPAWWGYNIGEGTEVSWSVVVNGVPYALPTVKVSTSGAVSQAKITLGFLTHGYNGIDTAIPQSTGFNTINSFRLVAEVTYGNNGWDQADLNIFNARDGVYRNLVKAQWYKADGTEVPGSLSYVVDWNPQRSSGTDTTAGKYDFVTQEWTSSTAGSEYVPLTWDHTLNNRAVVYSAEKAELVVELDKPIVGQATYTLYANNGLANSYYGEFDQGLWWNYREQREYVSEVTVNGSQSELRFPVDLKYLYDTGYGTYNRQFVIFENITLMNSSIMKNYLEVDRSKVGGAGSLGRLSWGESWAGDRLSLDGAALNYARTGKSGQGVQVGTVPFPNPVQTVTVTVPAGEGWTSVDVPDLKVAEGQTVRITAATGTANFPYQYGINVGSQIFKQGDGSFNGTEKSFMATYAEMVEKGYTGEGWQVYGNTWGGHNFDEFTLTVELFNDADIANAGNPIYDGSNASVKSDVRATAIYLNFPEAETEPAPDDTVVTPTEPGDQTSDDENVNVNDNEEPSETPSTPADNNPHTGVVLAVVPMLVAACAAVVAKKH